MEVANWILGGGTSLSSRLMERLRQKEGLSYSVYSQILLPGYGLDCLRHRGAAKPREG